MNLKVECIWCKTKTDFNRFARETKKAEDYDKFKNQIISYMTYTMRNFGCRK